jgi:hypothetical protein
MAIESIGHGQVDPIALKSLPGLSLARAFTGIISWILNYNVTRCVFLDKAPLPHHAMYDQIALRQEACTLCFPVVSFIFTSPYLASKHDTLHKAITVNPTLRSIYKHRSNALVLVSSPSSLFESSAHVAMLFTSLFTTFLFSLLAIGVQGAAVLHRAALDVFVPTIYQPDAATVWMVGRNETITWYVPSLRYGHFGHFV